MNLSFVVLFVIFIWKNVRAEYGKTCTGLDHFSRECVPIASCKNIDEELRNIIATGGSVPPDFKKFLQKSFCGIFDNARHICCEKDQIQYNANTIKELENLKCGKLIPHEKITGGKEVRHWNRPWMALLGYNDSKDKKFNCGGTLISDRYVLTAAHCVAGFEDQLQFVRLGEHKISEKTDCVVLNRLVKKCFDAIDVPIERKIIHEKYERGEIYNDIALLRLSKPLDLNATNFKNFISPICLPITDKLKNKINTIQEFYVTGWGLNERGSTSDVLLETHVMNRGNNVCSTSYNRTVPNSQICAGGTDNRDSCTGDSGGPLQADTEYTKTRARFALQFGIISAGFQKCGTKGTPALYTNVGHYMQWITDKMAGH